MLTFYRKTYVGVRTFTSLRRFGSKFVPESDDEEETNMPYVFLNTEELVKSKSTTK